LSPSDLERERDFYRQQCDALGARILAMQMDLTQAQRDAQQALTTVQLIREGYHLLAAPNTPLKEISRRFLRIILSKMGVDRAAFLRYLPERGAFLCDDLLGFPDSEWPAFTPPSTPGAFHYLNSHSTTDPLLDCLREAAGTPYLLWAFDQQARYALLLGNRFEDQHLQRPFEERDQAVVSGMLSVYLEVAQRKQVEEALRASEERYYLLFELAPDAYYLTDLEGMILDCNRAAEKQIGAPRDEIVGRHFLSMSPLPPAQLPGALSLFEQSEMGKGAGPTELTLNRKDGGQVEIEISTFPVKIQAQNLVLGIAHDITERVRAEAEIKAALGEKEVLLKEIHHRVKNNLQVISSLLSLQSNHTLDEPTQALFQDSRDRVRAMALVHEHLYQSNDLARINFSDYVQTLLTRMVHSYNLPDRQIEVQTDVDEVALPIDTAIQCGLIINELMTNALKHAFPNGRAGCVCIALRPHTADSFALVVRDDGVGLPPDFDLTQTKSLGLQLVSTLTTQLKGTIAVENGGQTVFQIVFPRPVG
jgi:PAS domain S-box-containing protein